MSSEIESVIGRVPTQLHIGGKWLDADDGATIEVIDPSTAKPLATVASGSAADAAAAVDAAKEALRMWRRTAPRDRADR